MKDIPVNEDVKEAMFDIKMASCSLGGVEEEEAREPITQVFPAYDILSDRVEKTLYYGRLPSTDRPSLALTKVAVEQFAEVGLQRLARLDMSRAADMSRDACAGPTSLVLALIYLDRLKKANPEYLATVSPADLFLVSMMVASKFIHDDGEEDEVFNDEWAKSGNLDVKELNRIEVDFLSAIDWRVNVPEKEFGSTLEKIEQQIAFREVSARGWASYTDLCVLSQLPQVHRLWNLLTEASVKVTAVCLAAYAASFLTLLGTATLLNQTPFGPSAVSQSFQTLLSADDRDASEPVPEPDRNSTTVDHMSVSTAELLTASLIVTTLASQPERDAATLDFTMETDPSAFHNNAAAVAGSTQDTGYGLVVMRNETWDEEIVNPPLWILEKTELIHHSTSQTDLTLSPHLLPDTLFSSYRQDQTLYSPTISNPAEGKQDRLYFGADSEIEDNLLRAFSKQWSRGILHDMLEGPGRGSKLQCPLRVGWAPIFNQLLVLG